LIAKKKTCMYGGGSGKNSCPILSTLFRRRVLIHSLSVSASVCLSISLTPRPCACVCVLYRRRAAGVLHRPTVTSRVL